MIPRCLRRAGALTLCLLCACAAPDWRRDLGPDWQQRIETGTQFQHRVVFKAGTGRSLHIYLDGDGRIWRTAQELFADPTAPQSLALQLMQRDPAPALLLGRPCYLDVRDSACAPRWWTAARYSEPVLASLLAVAQREAAAYDSVVLIGYSGGGALAALLAAQLPQTRALITLAGNLDTAAWAAQHQFGAGVIDASLNPATQPPLPAAIAQWHYAGADDNNVQWQWIAAFSARQPGAHFIKLDGADHRCCWLAQWPAPLRALDQNSRR